MKSIRAGSKTNSFNLVKRSLLFFCLIILSHGAQALAFEIHLGSLFNWSSGGSLSGEVINEKFRQDPDWSSDEAVSKLHDYFKTNSNEELVSELTNLTRLAFIADRTLDKSPCSGKKIDREGSFLRQIDIGIDLSLGVAVMSETLSHSEERSGEYEESTLVKVGTYLEMIFKNQKDFGFVDDEIIKLNVSPSQGHEIIIDALAAHKDQFLYNSKFRFHVSLEKNRKAVVNGFDLSIKTYPDEVHEILEESVQCHFGGPSKIDTHGSI